MKKLNLSEIQKAEVAILSKFDKICEEQQLIYSIYYGTLIGAVRHGGVIPWDDDIDVIMPRPYYESFISYCKRNKDKLYPFELMHYTLDDDYIFPISRLCDTRYTIDYHGVSGAGKGLFIDIYPIDGCGNDLKKAKKIFSNARLRARLISIAGLKRFTKSTKGCIVDFFKYLLYSFLKKISINQIICIADKKAQALDYFKSDYICNIVWPTYGEKEIMEKRSFENIITMSFDGLCVKAVKEYDDHLKRIYGDYMKIPPESERISHHYYNAYIDS